MEYANSSNQSAALKENTDDETIKRYADGGAVQSSNFIPDHEFVPDAMEAPNTIHYAPQDSLAPVPAQMQSPQALGQPQPMQLSPSQQSLAGVADYATNSQTPVGDQIYQSEDPFTSAVGAGIANKLGEGAMDVVGNEVGSLGDRVGKGVKFVDTTPIGSNRTVSNAAEQTVMPIGSVNPLTREQQAIHVLYTRALQGDEAAKLRILQLFPQEPKKLADGGVVDNTIDYSKLTPEAPTPENVTPPPTPTRDFIPDSEFVPDEERYGSPLEMAKTFGEGAMQGVLGPLAPVAEQAASKALFNQEPEETSQNIMNRQATNPYTHLAGEVTGLGGSMATGVGEGAIAAHLGEAALPAIAETAAPLARIGSRAVSESIANMAISSSDELTKLVLGNPDQTVESAAQDIGLSGLIGGLVGGTLSGTSELYKATVAPKMAEALSYIQQRLGGVEGQVPTTTDKLINASGLDIPAAQRAVINNDPGAQAAFSHLMQSDESASGKEIQEAYRKTHADAANDMIGALGVDPNKAIPEFSTAESGKNIGKTLASEYHEQISPLTEQFEKLKAKTQNADLIPDTETAGPQDTSNPYAPKPGQTIRTPGTVSKAADDIAQLAQREGWTASPSSDIMREVTRTLKELPAQKTLKDLGSYITAVGDNTASNLPFGQQTPLSRAGAMIKSVLRDAEHDTIIRRLGEKEGAETVSEYQAARAAYSQQAKLKDFLNDNLKVGGSTASFAKSIRSMAGTDSEALFNRLSGKNNSSLLEFLSTNYPKTAQAIREAHISSVLDKAASRAKDGEKISVSALRKSLESMQPEMRNFVASPETLTKIDTMGQILDKIQPKNYNFSNTARTLNKSLGDMGGSAMGVAAMMAGHNPLSSAMVGLLGKYALHSIPDAARLAYLKFLGSAAPVDAPAFKAMLNSIESAVRGEKTLNRSITNVFKAEREVLPEALHPSEKDRTRLQRQLDTIQTNPESLMDGKGSAAHYMPEHGVAQAQTVARASQYLDQLKPATKRPNPLDTPIKPTPSEKAAYDNALNIAHQPLIVLNKIKAGTATPADVAALKAMYPNLYSRYATKLTAEMTDALSKGVVIPYKTKLGLSQFLGQPMDSTMTSESILAAQPQPAQPPQAPPGTKPGEGVKHSTTGISKLPAQYNTQDQARQQRANKT